MVGILVVLLCVLLCDWFMNSDIVDCDRATVSIIVLQNGCVAWKEIEPRARRPSSWAGFNGDKCGILHRQSCVQCMYIIARTETVPVRGMHYINSAGGVPQQDVTL